MLVPNTTEAWYEALSRLIRDAAWRHHLAAGGMAEFAASGTLERQADTWPDVMRRKPG
jgi:hypothetical protein